MPYPRPKPQIGGVKPTFPGFTLAVVSLAREAFLAYCKAGAAVLITDHLGAANPIADALVERGELSGAEVDDIIAIALAREGLDDEKTRCAGGPSRPMPSGSRLIKPA